MKTQINYSETTEYNIETISLFNDFLIYKTNKTIQTTYKKKTISFEGIAHKKNISDKKVDFKCLFKAYKKEILEIINKNIFNENLYLEYLIEEPFSFIEKNSLEDIVLLKIDTYEQKIYDPHREIPTAFMFDNINGNITDRKYDLNKVIEKLSDKQKKYFDVQIFIKKSSKDEKFPIIGYKHHNKDNITWTKDR